MQSDPGGPDGRKMSKSGDLMALQNRPQRRTHYPSGDAKEAYPGTKSVTLRRFAASVHFDNKRPAPRELIPERALKMASASSIFFISNRAPGRTWVSGLRRCPQLHCTGQGHGQVPGVHHLFDVTIGA